MIVLQGFNEVFYLSSNSQYKKIIKMTFSYILCLLVTIVFCQNDILDNLHINPQTITISGFSSGGGFAHQFHTAFSASVGFRNDMELQLIIYFKDFWNGDICWRSLPLHVLLQHHGRGDLPGDHEAGGGGAHRPGGEHEGGQCTHLSWAVGLCCAMGSD